MQWRKKYAAFSKSPTSLSGLNAGQAVFLAGLIFLCYTGLIFKLLNLLLILWWFAPLVILPLLSVAGRKVISSHIDGPSSQPHIQGMEEDCAISVMHASHRGSAEHSQSASYLTTIQAWKS